MKFIYGKISNIINNLLLKLIDPLNFLRRMTKYLFKKMAVAFFMVFMICNLFAQKFNPEFIQLYEGLSQRTITCILQDSKGYMWFGTYNGLNKFDGNQIIVYENIKNDSTSLSHNLIADIFEDSKGNLWVGTEGAGLNLYDRKHNNFIRFQHHDLVNTTLSSDHITEIYEDKSGRLWIGTEGGGLNLLDPIKNTARVIEDSSYKNASSTIDFIYEDSKAALWVGYRGGELRTFDEKRNCLIPVHFSQGDLNNIGIRIFTGIVEDEHGDLWIGTYGYGIVVVRHDSSGKRCYIRYIHDENNVKSLSNNTVRSLYIDKTGKIWIGTENGGLNLFNREDNSFLHFVNDKNKKYSLSSNSIWSIFQDNMGRMWFGTFDQGLNIIDKYYSKFTIYNHIANNNSSLVNNNVTSFLEDGSGNLWIGSDGGGLDYFDRGKDTFIHFINDRKSRNSLSSDAVLTLCLTHDYKLWIGTWAGGINILKDDKTSFIHFNSENSKLPNDNIFKILEASDGDIYIATFGGGLTVYEKKLGRFIQYLHNDSDANSIGGDEVLTIYFDKKGNLWCGFHDDGMDMMKEVANSQVRFIHFRHNPDISNSLSDNRVNTFLEDSKNNFWIGTANGGLNLMDRDHQSFISFNKNDGLPSSDIVALLEDNKGNIWICTSKGISRFDVQTKKFRNYDVSDGLQGEEFIRNAAFKCRSGELCFGGREGFNIFSPDSIHDNPYPPKVYFKDFKIFNKSVQIGPHSVLQNNISETKEISLSYKQSVFTIEFVALNYTHAEKNQYAFKLDGLETDWNYVGSRHDATYTSLDAGRYVFRVKASNNDNVWNEQGASLIINVEPPFWDTLWFKLIVGAILILIIYVYFNVRMRIIKRNNILLENLVESRTRELNSKNALLKTQSDKLNETNTLLLERQQKIEEQTEELMAQRDELVEVNSVKDKLFVIVAHDLKNPFNSLLGFAELLSRKYETYSDEKRKELIKILLHSSKSIFDLLTNLLNWSRAQQGVIEFNAIMTNIIDLVHENIELLKNQANNKQISILQELPASEMIISIDVNLINVVIRNLLTNAIKYTNPGGIITVRGKTIDNCFTISITDTGVGIPEEKILQLFRKDVHYSTFGTNNERGTGLGLLICKDFIDMHKGKIWIERSDHTGSTFCFCLPIKD